MDNRGLMELGGFLITFCLGVTLGHLASRAEAADAAVSLTPPKWWMKALIDAEARKEKEDLR